MVAGKVLHDLAPAYPSDIISGQAFAHTLSLFYFLNSLSISLLHSLFSGYSLCLQCSLASSSSLATPYYSSLSANVTYMENPFLITFLNDFSPSISFFYLFLNSMYHHKKLVVK